MPELRSILGKPDFIDSHLPGPAWQLWDIARRERPRMGQG